MVYTMSLVTLTLVRTSAAQLNVFQRHVTQCVAVSYGTGGGGRGAHKARYLCVRALSVSLSLSLSLSLYIYMMYILYISVMSLSRLRSDCFFKKKYEVFYIINKKKYF